MKKATLIVICLCAFMQIAAAQENRNYSYIYIYRPKLTGLYSAFNSVSYFLKVANQSIENINAEGVRYKVYSTGRISINIIQNGTSKGITLNIDSFKDYYIKLDIRKANLLILEDAELAKKYLDTSLVAQYEEDLKAPINNSSGENMRRSEKGQGTCFLISANGYLITNNHCIEGAKEITVKGIDGDFTTKYGAAVIATDPSNDLALLKLGNKNLKFDPLPIGIRSSGVAQAEKVYALGFPRANAMGEEVKITEGIISSKSGVQGDVSKFQISAAVNPGNSGGPLIDESGNLIGIIYAKSTIAESAGYAIKAGYLEAFLKNVESFEYPVLVNTIKDKTLTDKVAAWKKCIYIVETN